MACNKLEGANTMSLTGTPHNAAEIADYFLSLQDEVAGDGISNLKLQKLLY